MLLLGEEEEVNVLDCPWHLRTHDERVIDPAINARTRRWLLVSSSPNIGEGQTLFTAGPFWVGSVELDRQVEFFNHIIALQNEKTMVRPRNRNREASGRFGRK